LHHSTNIFSGAARFKPDEDVITNTVLFSLFIILIGIWVIQFIVGVACIFMYDRQRYINSYLYIYTILFTFKWLIAAILASFLSVLSWMIIRLFCLHVSWAKFKSGWITLFILIIGVLLIISVPTGLHALRISRRLPLVFQIFIYLEVFMSALHVVQVLIDRILYVYSNDKDLIQQLEELPSKPRAPSKRRGKYLSIK